MSEDKKIEESTIKTLSFWGAGLPDPKEIELGDEVKGDCPLCGKKGHFYVNAERGVWDCKRCGKSGNQISFLDQLVESRIETATDDDWARLEDSRGIPARVLRKFGLALFDAQTWMIPVRSDTGHLHDVRKYDFKKMMSTAGCQLELWGIDRLALQKPGAKVHVCEGEWDGMAMRWLLQALGRDESEIVVAVPGAGSMKPKWVQALSRMSIRAWYDNDKAGDAGAEKFDARVRPAAERVEYVCWPASRPEGYDLRDFVKEALPGAGADATWKALEKLLEDRPRNLLAVEVKADGAPKDEPEKIEAITLAELLEVFDRNIVVTKDVEIAIKLVMATALSTDVPGDPIWMYLVGPPGAGKTLLLNALRRFDRGYFTSNLTQKSLVSGFPSKDESKDPSILAKLRDKTWIHKDFTEVLSKVQTERDVIFGILRGAYDGHATVPYGNGVVREYKDLHFSMLAGVTNAIHGHANASMGERFLKFQLPRLEGKHENDTIRAAIMSVGREKEIDDELCDAARAFLSRRPTVDALPAMTEAHVDRLTSLVKVIAYMRTTVDKNRFTEELLFRPVPENGTRLAKQLSKLAQVLAFAAGEDAVSEPTWSIVERVALDTAHGFNVDILEALMKTGGKNDLEGVSASIGIPTPTVWRRLEDLAILSVLTKSKKRGLTPGRPANEYVVNPHIQVLWNQAKGIKCAPPKAKRRFTLKPATKTTGFTLRRSRA